MRALIRSRPVLAYFVLVFVISWGGMLLVIGPGGIPGTPEQIERLFPLALLALLAGPSISGPLLTGLVDGRAGLRELLSRLVRWRVGVRWYAVALLAAPLIVLPLVLALSRTSPVYLPAIASADHKASLILAGLAVGLVGGFLEELGWTGFAIPRLRQRHGAATTGLIVGVVWSAWHFMMSAWISRNYSGTLSLGLFVPLYLVLGATQLPPYRMLMVWVYDQTRSLLVAILMHAGLIAGTLFVLAPVAIKGASFLTWILVLSAALWIVVAAVAIARGLGRRRGQQTTQAGSGGAGAVARPTG